MYRDFTINALTTAVREVIACFPIYRTYLVPGQPADEADSRIILRAIASARREIQPWSGRYLNSSATSSPAGRKSASRR